MCKRLKVFNVITTLIMSLSVLTAGAIEQSDKENTQLKKRPNILWIYIEDQNNWNNAYGDFTVDTPTIKNFADTGVRFNNTMQPAPVCSATRSALVTGKYQTTLGVHEHRSNRSSYNGIFLPKGYKTVPELFIDAGYKTFNIGKDDYNFKYDRSKIYNAHKGKVGFQGAHDGEKFNWAHDLSNQPFFGQIQLKGGKHRKFNADIPPVKSIDITLPPYYPDTPGYRKSWAKHYQTQVMSDIELKDILVNLEANGILDNTIIFWFSDHGMELLRHKQALYEDSVKVPFIVNWPAGNKLLRQKGAVRNELISGLDIPATSLALAGIEIPDYYDGKNLFADSFKGRDFVISAKDRMDFTFDRGRTVRTENYRYIKNFHPEIPRSQPQYRDKIDFSIEGRALFEQGKLNEVQRRYYAPTKPAEELYDLKKDPHQINNLASNKAYSKELIKHREILMNWIKQTDDKGQYPESETAIKETLDLWGKSCVSQACNNYRKKHPRTYNKPGDKIYPPLEWPSYLPKPKGSYYDELEDVYRAKFQ